MTTDTDDRPVDVDALCTCGHRRWMHDGSGCLGENACSCEAWVAVELEPFAVPDGYAFLGLGVCRSCGQAIAWALTKNDKRAPINRDGSSHFATCPSADAWRHRGRH